MPKNLKLKAARAEKDMTQGALAEAAGVSRQTINAIEKGELPRGIALCGSANGITITLNKHQGIRAAICWEPEIAELARKHNDANICSLPARFIDNDTAVKIVETFLNTDFEGGRHQRRIDKIPLCACTAPEQ